MSNQINVNDPKMFLNYIRETKAKGTSEKEIATSLGMTVSEFRRTRSDCLRKLHGKEPFPPDYKGSLDKKKEDSK